MKNLKKVLALGLALVMMMGMFTIASAAETKKTAQEFPDWGSVQNKDAVSLMVDLGVINGKTDGTYAPAETIDRASWAKMVFFVLTGETNGDIYASDYPVLKDISKNWAQGFIEYLYSIDCISGDNQGNYNPSQPISVVAAAKTMLTGLGYNSKIEGYEGDANWATNITNKAKSLGLLNNISLKQNDNITRDAAAQMVYNALSAQTVTAKYQLNFMTGERVPSGEYEKGETLGEKAFEIRKFTTKVTGVTKGIASFDNSAIKGDVKASLSDVGKSVAVWCKFTSTTTDGKTTYTAKDAVSTSVAAADNTAFKTVTGGVDFTKCYTKANKDDFIAEAVTGGPTYYVNGGAGTTTAPTVGVGDVVEFYTNDDGNIDVVHVYEYSIAKVTADPTSKTKDDVTTVTLNFGGFKLPTDQITGDWASLKKDDIVLYYAQGTGANAVVTFELAEKVSGKATRLSGKGDKLTVNGTDYTLSEITGTTATFTNWDDYKNEYDLFLDKNGSVAIMNKITDEVTSDVALVLESAWVGAQGGIGGAKGYAQANLLFADGTTEIVKVVKVDSAEKDALEGVMGGNKMLTGKTAVFVEASEDNGDWTLTTIADAKVDDIAANAVVENKITFTTGFTADNETVFIVAKGNDDDGYAYTVHTGYANVPGLTTSKESYAYTKESGAADYVYLVAESFTGDAPEGYVYFKSATADYTNADKNKVYSVIDAKGAEIELVMKSDITVSGAGFYEVKAVNDDGVVTALKNTTAATTAAVTASGKGVFGADKVVSYDNSTVCVVIDLNAKSEFDGVSTFDPDSLDFATGSEDNYSSAVALIVGDANAVADYIYVVRTAR